MTGRDRSESRGRAVCRRASHVGIERVCASDVRCVCVNPERAVINARKSIRTDEERRVGSR